ncbi:hypothetical protein OG589_40470 [Sphaerisporangium sp. NBC_01403]|uniref:hypothetical protein n=1 Tax=Sphaerisporangium sp. NBC_01403 TaxID=2903599 RepID=UPI0032497B2A
MRVGRRFVRGHRRGACLRFQQSQGLTPAQMRWLVQALVLLAVFTEVGAWTLRHPDAAGIVVLLTASSALTMAQDAANLIGRAFDKLYPPE